MKVQYFEDTDTLYIEFRGSDISETRDLDENTVLDMDADRNVCAITFEHASQRTDVDHLTVARYRGITSPQSGVLAAAGLQRSAP